MYAGLARNLIIKLQSVGFFATQLGSGVLVSLNRAITPIEVQAVLGDWYTYRQVAKNQVMVEER